MAAPERVSQAPYIVRIVPERRSRARRLRILRDQADEEGNRARRCGAGASHVHANSGTPHSHRTGLSPSRLIQKIPLGGALNLIERTRFPLDQVAENVGLADAAVLHRLVVRHTGQSPGRFRSKSA